MLIRVLSLVAVVFVSSAVSAQKPAWKPEAGQASLKLWPHGGPGAADLGPEVNLTTAKDALPGGKPIVRLGNVSAPTLTVYAPKGKNSGAAVVVFPGGGYQILAIDLEGSEVCDWLTPLGVTCVLLKYRVPESGPYPKSAAALQDAQRALGMVREHAPEWGIDPKRIGVLGFSAGAHLAAALGTHFEKRFYERVDAADDLGCRPDFAVIVYPWSLALPEKDFAANADIHVTEHSPPSFIVQAEDDPLHVENATVYFLALKNARVPAELHLYAEGGHGFGLRSTLAIGAWPKLAETWLRNIHALPAK